MPALKSHIRPEAQKEPSQPAEFKFEDCDIPPEHPFTYTLDSHGVFQVYSSTEQQEEPLYKIMTLKEFFKDLDFLVNIVNDGPARSFAFRRMKYLENKWQMYSLLNEYQELSDMKVSASFLPVCIES